MALPRRKVPLAIALKVALRQLGLNKPELDHDPALGLRERTEDGKYIPDEHDPDYLVWLEGEDDGEHDVKTNGTKATAAGGDIHKIAKAKRLSKEQEEFRRRMLTKECGSPPPRTGKIKSRGFEKRPANGWR